MTNPGKAIYSVRELREEVRHRGLVGNYAERATRRELPVRLLPEAASNRALALLVGSHVDSRAVVTYLRAAFFFYRECVNLPPRAVLGVPHVSAAGTYEWPRPVLFAWDDFDQVRLYGSLVHRPVKQPTVFTNDGSTVRETSLLHGETLERPVFRVDRLEEEIEFEVPRTEAVAFIDMMEWQMACLRTYVNPLRDLPPAPQPAQIVAILQGIQEPENIGGYRFEG